MREQKTGGPAFPTVMIDKPEGGMTLRDYFAAKAMPQMLAICGTRDTASIEAYRIADAMLKARGM